MNKLNNRAELAEYFAELGFTKGAEIGVYRGYYSRELLEKNLKLNILCVDSWSLNEGWGLKKNQQAFPICLKTLAPYRDRYTILKGISVEVAKFVLDESLDFVYIDADHSYEAVKNDLEAWTPKVRKGGIVSGHDYFKDPRLGVIEAVDEFVEKYNYELKLTEWNDPSVRGDRQPSFYFVKN